MKKSTTQVLALSILAIGWAGGAVAEGDPAAGQTVFAQCMACHSINEGETRVGPSLYGVFERVAGSAEGYSYSPALRDSGVVWTAENLDAHLADVPGFIPGNRMGILNPQGLPDAQDRADVIAYLQTVSATD